MTTAEAEHLRGETAAGSAKVKDTGESSEERYAVRVLDRAFCLLRLLSDGAPRTLTQLSAEARLNSSTTFRLLSALGSHDYAARDPRTGEYSVGYACLDAARGYLQGSDLRNTALPHLRELRDATRETVHLAMLDRWEIVYIEKLEGLYAVGLMTSRVGGRNPAYCTGLGKVLLAHADRDQVRRYFDLHGLEVRTPSTVRSVDELMRTLAEIRARGFAFDQGEHKEDVRCIAAPVFDARGRAVAALSVSGPADRMDPLETNWSLIDHTMEAARRTSAGLGYPGAGR